MKKKRASGCHQSIPSTWSSGDVEDDTDTGPGSYGIINGEDSINRNGSPDRGGRFAPLKSNDDQDEETLNEISLDHITLEHESGSNGNAHFEHATSALPPPPPSSSSPSSSPSKMGGCPSGEFICVTEICCDEIEIDDKGRKPIGAGAGLNGNHVSSSSNVNNLSLAAASYSEAPASGNL